VPTQARRQKATPRRAPRHNFTTPKAEKRFDDRRQMYGLFAKEPIKAGEIVWIGFIRPDDCEFLDWARVKTDPHHVRYAYQIDQDLFSLTREIDLDISNYFNHACAPSTRYDYSREVWSKALTMIDVKPDSDDELEVMVAARDIAVNEELTMDYASFWVIADLEFTCACGASSCRRALKKDDYRGLPRDHVSRYVRSLLRSA
jgi:SET domain-containing protein